MWTPTQQGWPRRAWMRTPSARHAWRSALGVAQHGWTSPCRSTMSSSARAARNWQQWRSCSGPRRSLMRWPHSDCAAWQRTDLPSPRSWRRCACWGRGENSFFGVGCRALGFGGWRRDQSSGLLAKASRYKSPQRRTSLSRLPSVAPQEGPCLRQCAKKNL